MGFTADILVVEDEKLQLDSVAGFLTKLGYRVHKALMPSEAIAIARNEHVDVVLSDFNMPGMTGVELLRTLKEINPAIDVVIMTAYGTVESATEAMKLGAIDYLTKPIDLQQLRQMLHRIVERNLLISENQLLRQQLNERFSFDGIISRSSAMSQVLNIAGRVASSNATVLITGETGTGKELMAKAVHYASPRREKPFIAVNCAALSENLLESELFGHEKGAFTGADRQRKGRFESAEGGTLFIDEVGEIPLSIQVKLLRVLQEKTFERVGSSLSQPTNVRIVAATNRDLEAMVAEGTFREDFYYRLNVVTIHLPPLRKRREDIPLLIDSFVLRIAAEHGKEFAGVTREAMDQLAKYDWPGNVRELENVMQQAVVLSRNEYLTLEDLPRRVLENRSEKKTATRSFSGNFTEQVESFEQTLIEQALNEVNQVQTRAAELLGISERHLRYKLKKYGMK